MILPLLSAPVPFVSSDDKAVYCSSMLKDLKLKGQELPDIRAMTANLPAPGPLLWPMVILDGEGEAYVYIDNYRNKLGPIGNFQLVARTAEQRDVTGVILLPSPKQGVIRLRFTMPAKATSRDARVMFYYAKLSYYQKLLYADLPGTAWFRHQVRQCQATLFGVDIRHWNQSPILYYHSRTEFMNWFDLLTGGRALSENLWLDRQLNTFGDDRPAVSIKSLAGINVPPFDWLRLIKKLNPVKDPLASKIPGDQHAVFFPSIDAAVKLAHEASMRETVVLRLAQPRSEHSRIQERYEQQFCLKLDRLAEILKSNLAQSVALTGSDPYVSTGTDVALLIESPNPKALAEELAHEIDLTAQKSGPVETIKEEILGLTCRGVRSDDRRISSIVTVLDDQTVVMTNSVYQLQRLANARENTKNSLASLPEYTWFREHYRRGDPRETALLVISDATIRRWCSPRWRIGQARRVWNAAVLAEVQAMATDQLVIKHGENKAEIASSLSDLPNDIKIGQHGVYSPQYGSLDFLTPVAELTLDWVSNEEANAYKQWRNQYQQQWQRFDPIAMRLELDSQSLAADLTVTPLVQRTQYAFLQALTQGVKIRDGMGNHREAIVQLTLAINKQSPIMQMLTLTIPPQLYYLKLLGEALDWFDQSISVYLDDDPSLDDLTKLIQEIRHKGFDNNYHKVPSAEWIPLVQYESLMQWVPIVLQSPIGIRIESTSNLKLTQFLLNLRSFLEATVPGMLKWELRTYREQAYARVSLSELFHQNMRPEESELAKQLEKVAIYYAIFDNALEISLQERVLQRAIDRNIERHATPMNAESPTNSDKSWQGQLKVKINKKLLLLLSSIAREDYQSKMQQIAWSNLPILNEWNRRYPSQDPLTIHERLWQTRLICPGGGAYVWDEQWQSFTSTVYGHPGNPKNGPAIPPLLEQFRSLNFDLGFENQGLRARIVLERDDLDKEKTIQDDRH